MQQLVVHKSRIALNQGQAGNDCYVDDSLFNTRKEHAMQFKEGRLKDFLAPAGIILLMATGTVQAAEIYGRVVVDGKIVSGANVIISCSGFEDNSQTDRYGVYRSKGPTGEQPCEIRVNGSNSIKFFTSKKRTRVNLEVTNNELYRR